MERVILQVGILVFTGWLVWFMANPNYLWFLLLLMLTRKPHIKKSIEEQYASIDYKLGKLLGSRGEE
jgi:hypothetical protein